jgi:hypothetical protein
MAKRFLTDHKHGPLITRGANICLYQLREASQGEDIYLDVNAFLKDKDKKTKAAAATVMSNPPVASRTIKAGAKARKSLVSYSRPLRHQCRRNMAKWEVVP